MASGGLGLARAIQGDALVGGQNRAPAVPK
jgi:hypothetical protein